MQEVGRALSRYDGYSTYVNLETILSVPTSVLFESNPSCYAAELISEVEKQGISRRAAQDCLRHGISLGFLERIISRGGMLRLETGSMKKIDETARIALSPLGRSLRAAGKLDNNKFQNFLVTGVLLDHDFDMYGLLLKSASKNHARRVNLAEFGEQFRELIQQRNEWLEWNIFVRPMRDQVYSYVQRATRNIKDTSIKHHFSMRQQWAKHLLHIDNKGLLTDIGYDYARLIAGIESKNSMFWLAPTSECLNKLGAPSKKSDSIFSAWDLLRPDMPESDPRVDMIQRVADFMESAFGIIRLRVFAQAPLAAVIPYIYFQEVRLNQRVNIRATLDAVIRENRETFYCMLTANPEESHYQLRSRRT